MCVAGYAALYTIRRPHHVAAVMGVVSMMCRNGYPLCTLPPLPPPHRSLWDPQTLRTIDAVYSGPSWKSSLHESACVYVCVCA